MITLPLKGIWPGPSAYSLEPAVDHLQEHTEKLILAQHYLVAYYGHGHVCQPLGVRPTTGQGLCRSASVGSFTRLLVYPITPRRHMVGLQWAVLVVSDSGGTLRVHVRETATDIDVAFAGGTALVLGSDPAVNRPELRTHAEIHLEVAGTGTWADIRHVAIADLDLTAAQLP